MKSELRRKLGRDRLCGSKADGGLVLPYAAARQRLLQGGCSSSVNVSSVDVPHTAGQAPVHNLGSRIAAGGMGVLLFSLRTTSGSLAFGALSRCGL